MQINGGTRPGRGEAKAPPATRTDTKRQCAPLIRLADDAIADLLPPLMASILQGLKFYYTSYPIIVACRRPSMSIAFVFPGQGSQSKGMGVELFDEYAAQVAMADEILGYSVKTLCLEDPEDQLNLTRFTQPALFIVNSLMYLNNIKGSKVKPDFLAGHSLGEYTALFAGGAFDFETGVKLVQKRGELMGKAKGGGMAAVIGLGPDQVQAALESSKADTIDVANYNSPKQIILSGPLDDIDAAKQTFLDAGARRYLPLKVSAAFHSRYMDEAGREFSAFLESVDFGSLEIPVISNVTARPYESDNIRENLGKQITNSVRWQESIEYLIDRANPEFIEVGPGNVLTRLVQQIAETRGA